MKVNVTIDGEQQQKHDVVAFNRLNDGIRIAYADGTQQIHENAEIIGAHDVDLHIEITE